MELYRQNLKISGRNTGISWKKWRISWRNFPLFLPEKRQLIMEKNKKCFFFLYQHCIFTATVTPRGFVRREEEKKMNSDTVKM